MGSSEKFKALVRHVAEVQRPHTFYKASKGGKKVPMLY
jgi:hypothetical protein